MGDAYKEAGGKKRKETQVRNAEKRVSKEREKRSSGGRGREEKRRDPSRKCRDERGKGKRRQEK